MAVKSPQDVQLVVFELRSRFLDVVEEFTCSHPGVPVQAILASLGEIFLQLALTHLGPGSTLMFIEQLREAASRFGDRTATGH